MAQPPNLLNDDGSASMATMLLLSHHAFRRDIGRFIRAVAQIKAGDASRAEAVRGEWEKSYRQALHGHHTMEDSTIFPDIRSKHPDLAYALDTLTQQHHQIDPVLEKGDAAFADLAHPEHAEAVLGELKTLLEQHLEFEEAQITPSLRDGKEFPVPADENMAAMYAQGFSWSMQGIAPEVLEQVRKMLPDILLAKLPAAQAEFEARSERVWGSYAVGSSTTPVPKEF
ncbi:MAG TPA: hemerythrin domain-containing protein [Candidatus Eisenbacteria bacterium]|nr:hemerythrin domain-containing protein [Candidatus Eisenbacteria bacterium]